AQGQLVAFSAMMGSVSRLQAWLITLLVGLLAGLGFALLYPRPRDGAGAGLIRGMTYGFLWWVAGALTLPPLLSGAGPSWSLDAARSGFASLPGYLLFGAAIALFYQWLNLLARLLFVDIVATPDEEGVGAEGLRALGRGAVGGLVGGALFTFVMVQIGF